MKRFLLFSLLAFILTSCCISEDETFVDDNQVAFIGRNCSGSEEDKGAQACKETESRDSAYVRVGMYNRVEGYDLQVLQMWVESTFGDVDLPDFDSNIVDVGVLSRYVRLAVFDRKDGRYNPVGVTGKPPTLSCI